MHAYLVILQAGLKYVLVLWLIVYLGRSQDYMPLQVGERIAVMGLKILGRVGTHFFNVFFPGISPIKMHVIIYFPENLKTKNLGFTSKFR